MPRWIVQRFVPDRVSSLWTDIEPPERIPSQPPVWEAADAGSAFVRAVLENSHAETRPTSYRVLPFEGGATIHLEFNLTADEHTEE